MRISGPGAQILQYFDRSPLTVIRSYTAAGVSPHSATVRDTYTVPNGRVLYLAYFMGILMRVATATMASLAMISLQIGNTAVVNVPLRSSAIGDYSSVNTPIGIFLPAGTTVRIVTSDLSNLGALNYDVSWLGVEFDKIT